MTRHFMPGIQTTTDPIRPPLSDPPQEEEGRMRLVTIQRTKDGLHADIKSALDIAPVLLLKASSEVRYLKVFFDVKGEGVQHIAQAPKPTTSWR
jgi:hypothetical protein